MKTSDPLDILEKGMMKSKKSLVLITGVVILLVASFLILSTVVFLASGAVNSSLKDGDVISEKYNICLHTEANNGSGDWINIFSYYCDKDVGWDDIYQGDYTQKGVLDVESSGECVDVDLIDEASDSKTLYIKRNFVCALFSLPSWGDDRKFKVDEEGRFEALNSYKSRFLNLSFDYPSSWGKAETDRGETEGDKMDYINFELLEDIFLIAGLYDRGAVINGVELEVVERIDVPTKDGKVGRLILYKTKGKNEYWIDVYVEEENKGAREFFYIKKRGSIQSLEDLKIYKTQFQQVVSSLEIELN